MSKVTVCLIGIDGAGKTTHIAALMRELRSRGVNYKYAYMRGKGFRFFSLPFQYLYRFLKYDTNIEETCKYHMSFLYSVQQNAIVKFLWAISYLFDVFILITLRRYITMLDVILCDRYIFDSVVDLMVALKDNSFYQRPWVNLFLRLTKPSVAILLDLSEEEAFYRKKELSLESLRLRRVLYKRIALDLGVHIIDSNRPFKTVHRNILNCLEDLVNIANGQKPN